MQLAETALLALNADAENLADSALLAAFAGAQKLGE
jgi:hypothetical protein